MQRLIGGILLAVGALIAGASGLCSLFVIGTSIASPGEWTGGGVGGFFGSILIILMFGGIPFLVGAGLFMLGRRMVRSAEPPVEPSPAEPDEPAVEPDKEA